MKTKQRETTEMKKQESRELSDTRHDLKLHLAKSTVCAKRTDPK